MYVYGLVVQVNISWHLTVVTVVATLLSTAQWGAVADTASPRVYTEQQPWTFSSGTKVCIFSTHQCWLVDSPIFSCICVCVLFCVFVGLQFNCFEWHVWYPIYRSHVYFTVTGYKHYMGQVLQSKDLEDIISGLRMNDLLRYSHILTGMITSIPHHVTSVLKLQRSDSAPLAVGHRSRSAWACNFLIKMLNPKIHWMDLS